MFSLRAFVPRQAATTVRCLSRSARSILDDDSTPVDLSEDNDAVNGVRRRYSEQRQQEPTPDAWQTHRKTIQENFPAGWNPPRKLSRDAMEGLRQLHRLNPQTFTTPVLAERFRISPEAVRRILKSRWEPPAARRVELRTREAKAREEFHSLSALRERMETRQVLQSKNEFRASKRMDHEEQDGGEDEPKSARGLHARDRLAFE
ncbi:hypothetical protein FB45DRAFT_473405 [Roridomyces roridus]|uniref:Required for respiratory growth protein 9, mitochondrial n=1 Tax=Roridomyces roridus TaxID=1738132 RepID=A0AAD7FNX1_9AGAR|nr:hypothetical protein FB45DRAFT_473405 [Roridomyces roridus]